MRKTEDEARASYQVLQQKYASVLGGREARFDLGDKGVPSAEKQSETMPQAAQVIAPEAAT